jgi:hypothetical protein
MNTSKRAIMLAFVLTAISGGAYAQELLVDSDFNGSVSSVALRANSAGQDWYESREYLPPDGPALLTLDSASVGGNSTPKARLTPRLIGSDRYNAYLTQEFSSPQTRACLVEWDIYVDSILDIGDAPDRAGWMLIGDNTGINPDRVGPNAEDEERFVYMGFYKDGGGTTGTMDLVARQRNDPWREFTTVATGLNLKQWYTIKVTLDLAQDTYDVYVNGERKAKLTSRTPKSSVTYISFAQWHDGSGTFYVDNVTACTTTIKYERWMNIGGTNVAALTSDSRYPDNPDAVEYTDTFESPVDWADNYGQRLYGLLKPPQTGNYTFWIAGDDAQELWLSTDSDPDKAVMIARANGWTAPREWTKEPGQKSAPVPLRADQKYFIQALGKEGGGGDSTAVAWQGPGIVAREVIRGQYVDAVDLVPRRAWSPSPRRGAMDLGLNVVTSWRAGAKAVLHDVYFGHDADAVGFANTRTADIYKGRQSGTTYNPGVLLDGQKCFWRVDEVNPTDPGSPRKGDLWWFSTAGNVVIDNFESYVNDDPSRSISKTWFVNGPSATDLFLDETLWHGRDQSMALCYNNFIAPYYSETYRAWAPPATIALGQGDSLSLYVRGRPGNYPDTLYVAITNSTGQTGVVTHADPGILQRDDWSQWRIRPSEFGWASFSSMRQVRIGVGDRRNPWRWPSWSYGDNQVNVDDVALVTSTGKPIKLTGETIVTLDGYLRDTNGYGIPNAANPDVTVGKQTDDMCIPQVYRSDGYYWISLPTGSHAAKVEADGFVTQEFTWEVLDNQTKDFTLQRQ